MEFFGDKLCSSWTACWTYVFIFKREERRNKSKEAVGMERVAACTHHCEGDGLLIQPCQHNRSRFPGAAFLPRKNLAAT